MKIKPKPKKWVEYFRVDGCVYKSVTGQVSRLWRGAVISNYWHYGINPRVEDGERCTVLWVRLRTRKV